MNKRIVYIFNTVSGVGLGHYSRLRALRHWLNQVLGNDSVIIGWGTSNSWLSPLVDNDAQFFYDGEILPYLINFEPDIVILDSYNTEQLQFIAEHLHLPIKVTFAEGLTSRRIKGFDVLLDPTLSIIGSIGPEKIISGLDAIVLNKENYIREDLSKSCLDGVFFNFGKSKAATQMLDRLVNYGCFGQMLDVRPGSSFGIFSVAGLSKVNIGELNRHAAKVVVTAGQAMWEAALNRSTFYLVALTSTHTDLIKRLGNHCLLRLNPVPISEDFGIEVHHCVPTPETRQRLDDPKISALNIAKTICAASSRD